MTNSERSQRFIAQVVGDWTGIPVGKMVRDEVEQILSFGENLRERIVGQEHAVEVIERKVRAAKAGIQNPEQPIGVFLLVWGLWYPLGEDLWDYMAVTGAVYFAGAAALLASAALAEDLPVVGAWLRTALRRGARPLPEESVLDQGPGMVDVGSAWEVYRELAGREAPEPLDWTVETVSPDAASGSGPTAYWRGGSPPLPPDQQEVTVTPRFRDRATDGAGGPRVGRRDEKGPQ